MKLYITYGTVDYLAKLVKKHTDKKLRLMANNQTAVLFHETDGKTIFNVPKKYDILYSSGDLANGAYALVNNIPVSSEARPLFEKTFQDESLKMEKQTGISAIRLLRPLKGDTYIILTLWESEQYSKAWQESTSFDTILKKTGSNGGLGQPLANPAYVAKYYSVDLDE
ncbi:antibiotic biosynthesis monooxygenase [uncultured Metabacillus sp.]|uniref:antibiotic biosynthesis monooxygenase family protein n=1 Tax=uncultured Metabacillus sp. TaxID=2860135 RepID=UPI002613F251|nr:antibiotic biosynthesis monooxygenase [uncultured Metabacillus sp.]